jgi:hypothetical protein
MEFQQWYDSIPKITKYYLLSVFATTFFMTYIPGIPVARFLYFDLDKVLSFQVKDLLSQYY